MVPLNLNTVIEDSIVMAFGLRSYIDILFVIQQDNFVARSEFKKAFNAFYRVRQKSALVQQILWTYGRTVVCK